jgi:hypothetical protein
VGVGVHCQGAHLHHFLLCGFAGFHCDFHCVRGGWLAGFLGDLGSGVGGGVGGGVLGGGVGALHLLHVLGGGAGRGRVAVRTAGRVYGVLRS